MCCRHSFHLHELEATSIFSYDSMKCKSARNVHPFNCKASFSPVMKDSGSCQFTEDSRDGLDITIFRKESKMKLDLTDQ